MARSSGIVVVLLLALLLGTLASIKAQSDPLLENAAIIDDSTQCPPRRAGVTRTPFVGLSKRAT
jgi:hypothetical protein